MVYHEYARPIARNVGVLRRWGGMVGEGEGEEGGGGWSGSGNSGTTPADSDCACRGVWFRVTQQT